MLLLGPHAVCHMHGKYLMPCYLCSVIIDKYKMAIKFYIHLASDIPAWNRVLAFVPPYMGVIADFMPIRPFTDFIRDKRQGSQIWFFFHFKDVAAAAGAFGEGLSLNSFTALRIPVFNAANDVSVSFLGFAMTAVAIFPTLPSALAFCFGFLTPVGIMATE